MAKKKETKGDAKAIENNEPKTQKTPSLEERINELQEKINKIESLKEELREERKKFDGLVNDNGILHACIEKLADENERQADQIEQLSEIPLIQRLFCYNRTVKRITGKK